MAKTLFPGTTQSGPWTADEVQSLKRYIGVAQEEIIARILGRTLADVKAQILDLGRIHTDAQWSQSELVELKRMYGTRTDEDIARIFGRTLESVTAKATELCLAKDKAFIRKLSGTAATRMPRWTPEEIKKLEELYPEHSNLEIAQMLDRSVKSVVSKAHNLGLRKDRDRLAEMGRQNVSLRYGRRQDGTKDPDIDAQSAGDDSAGDDSADNDSATITPQSPPRQTPSGQSPSKQREAGGESSSSVQPEPPTTPPKSEEPKTKAEGDSGS